MKSAAAAALILTAIACMGGREDGNVRDGPLIAAHLAHAEQLPESERVAYEDQELFMDEAAVFSDSDIEDVHMVKRDDRVVLDVRLGPEGAERLRSLIADAAGRRLVVLFDSRVIGAPVIRSEIANGRFHMAVPAASDGEASEIIESVRARWPFE